MGPAKAGHNTSPFSWYIWYSKVMVRRGGRVVEGARLESVWTWKCLASSNLAFSAIWFNVYLGWEICNPRNSNAVGGIFYVCVCQRVMQHIFPVPSNLHPARLDPFRWSLNLVQIIWFRISLSLNGPLFFPFQLLFNLWFWVRLKYKRTPVAGDMARLCSNIYLSYCFSMLI